MVLIVCILSLCICECFAMESFEGSEEGPKKIISKNTPSTIHVSIETIKLMQKNHEALERLALSQEKTGEAIDSLINQQKFPYPKTEKSKKND